MFRFLDSISLKKDNLKGIARLMYQDVSEDPWDRENLTKNNLNFTMESLSYIDQYANNLMGTELLNKYFDNMVNRIGAYIGEVIKNNIKRDFHWYEFQSIYNFSSKLDHFDGNIKGQSLLYSKKSDTVILPLFEVSQYLQGKSSYPDLTTYVEEKIRLNIFE